MSEHVHKGSWGENDSQTADDAQPIGTTVKCLDCGKRVNRAVAEGRKAPNTRRA